MSEELNKNGTNNGSADSVSEERKARTVLGFVLLKDANLDWLRFRKNLEEDWSITFPDEVKEGAVVFAWDDYRCAISLMPSPVPNGEAEACARNNVLWKEAAEETAKHAAHVMIAVMNTDEDFFDPVDAAVLFSKLASAMLKLDNTIGIYKNPTVFEKNFYIDVAEHIKQDQIPIPIMLHIGMYGNSDKRLCAFTYGMRFYGREEMEVIGSKAQPQQLFNFMLAISDYVLTGDVELKDGETVGFSENQHLSVTLSKAVSYNGNSLKIGFMTDN